MKINTPIFIIGLIVFLTPIVGLPRFYEQVVLAACGIIIMLLIAGVNLLKKNQNSGTEIYHESVPDRSPSQNHFAGPNRTSNFEINSHDQKKTS